MADATLQPDAREAYRLFLFLSVDLSGSTAFKFSNQLADKGVRDTDAERERGWLTVIQKFYQHFHRTFLSRFDAETARNSRPKLWKALGDELIYRVEVTETRTVAHTTLRFIETVHSTRKVVRDMSRSLDLKASAWLADFPARNAIVDLNGLHDPFQDRETPTTAETVRAEHDYIGPSMDAGFRLGKMASRRKMPLSVELAYVLAQARSRSMDYGFTFGYDGRVELKGVLGGEDYPVVWLDIEDDLLRQKANNHEAGLLQQRPDVLYETVSSFCGSFINSSPWMEAPYLKDDQDGPFNRVPQSFTDYAPRNSNRAREEGSLYDENADGDALPADAEDITSDDLLKGVLAPVLDGA